MSASVKMYINGDSLYATFPFKRGEILDEQLDAASVIVYSRVPYYTPGTRVQVTVGSGTYGYADGYEISLDNAAEVPAGSGIYKHELSLIELTKEGEGIICPSLTFTNALGITYPNTGSSEVSSSDITVTRPNGTPEDPTALVPAASFTLENIPPSISVGTKLPTPSAVAEAFLLYLQTNGFGYSEYRGQGGQIVSVDPSTTSTGDIAYYTVPGYSQKYYSASLSGAALTFDPKTTANSFTVRYSIPLYTNYTAGIGYIYYVPLTFVAQESIKPLARYTITDAVNRVLQLCEPLTADESPRYTFDAEQAEKYSHIYAPEFTMTQSTLREQLKVIGAYIHAEPYLTWDNVWHFLEYGQSTDASMPTGAPLISHTSSYDINQYCTDIRSNVQNLVSSMSYMDAATAEPGVGVMRSIRSETQYARINDESGYFPTDQAIYTVKRLRMYILGEEGTSWGVTGGVDITPYLFEETDYYSKLESFGTSIRSRTYAIYYKLGQEGIRGLFYREENAVDTATFSKYAIANIYSIASGMSRNDVQNYLVLHPDRIAFNIEYEPISNLFMSHGKPFYNSSAPTFSQIYNQSENMVEREYFGENVKGVAARLGNVEETRTYVISADRYNDIPSVGAKLDGYSITAVNVEVYPQYIKFMLGLSKDFEKISEYVGVSSVKRMYEISERQVSDRDILVKEYCVISNSPPVSGTGGGFFSAFMRHIIEAFNPNGVYLPAILADVSYRTINSALISNVYVPVVGRAIGNVMHYSFAMKDNYSAGVTTFYYNQDGVTGRFTTDAPYTDEYGRAYYVIVSLISDLSREQPFKPYANAYTLPLLNLDYPASFSYLNTQQKYLLRKDSRERISYNFELEFKTDASDIIIGSALAESVRTLSNSREAIEVGLVNVGINGIDRYYQGSMQTSGVSLSLNPSGGTITISYPTNETIDANTMWVIRTAVNTDTQVAFTESGEEITENVTTGGKVLLAGKMVGFTNGSRTLYFNMIRK